MFGSNKKSIDLMDNKEIEDKTIILETRNEVKKRYRNYISTWIVYPPINHLTLDYDTFSLGSSLIMINIANVNAH